MHGIGECADDFCCGTYDSKNAMVGGIIREILLLDGAQGFGGGSVASKNDKGASAGEKFLNGLEGELIDYVEGTRAVGGTRIIA